MALRSSVVRVGSKKEYFVKNSILFSVTLGFFAVYSFAGSAAENTIATSQGPIEIHAIEHATFVMQWNENPSRMTENRSRDSPRTAASFSRTTKRAMAQPFSVPLVEGIASFWRGSISQAVRNTRATALKQVSAM